MLKNYKYRLYPNKKQQVLLEKHFGCSRFVYNWGLETKVKEYEKTGKSPMYFALSGRLPKLKLEHEWLKEVSAQSLQMSLRNLDNTFTRFFRKKSRFPKFKSKGNNEFVRFKQHNVIDFESGRLFVSKFGEGIKGRFHRRFKGETKTIVISKSRTNKYFASVIVDDEKHIPEKKSINRAKSVGIDLGLKHFATLSTGEKIDNPQFLIKSEKRLKKLQRRMDRKKEDSKNRGKARLKVAILHEKVANQRRDFLHKLSARLISENQAVCLEDLQVSNMVKNHHLAKRISDVGWRMFRTFLEYKAEWYGKHVLVIGRFEPSSRMCNICGTINSKLTLRDREWTCECGAHHDRDILAAKNILNFAFCTPGCGGT